MRLHKALFINNVLIIFVKNKMMKYLFCFTLLMFVGFLKAQEDSEILMEIKEYQTSENEKFSNPETTILDTEDFKAFKNLDFYPINLKHRIQADFIRTPNEKPFLMPTSTERLPEYVKYGEIHFTIDNTKLKLNLYQSTTPYEKAGYENTLFLPFTDLTSGDGSYGGGRFMDVQIPLGNMMIIDFNFAYNPYCAYSHRYSCPIPPKENDLLIRIEAGAKEFAHH